MSLVQGCGEQTSVGRHSSLGSNPESSGSENEKGGLTDNKAGGMVKSQKIQGGPWKLGIKFEFILRIIEIIKTFQVER